MAVRPTGSVSVNETDLHYGQSVTFTVETDGVPTYVLMTATQNEAVVAVGYSLYHYDAPYVTAPMGLYSGVWQSGAAECTAELVLVLPRGRKRVLATASFEVAA